MWYGIILTIGILLLASGVYRFNRSMNFIKSGTRVAATVVELESYKSKGDVLYRPIFQYRVGVEEYRYTYKFGSRPASWQVGEETHLMIAPDNPEEPIVLTYFGAFGWSVVLIAISLPMIFIGAGYFWANNFIQKLIVV